MSNFNRKLLRRVAEADGLPANSYLASTRQKFKKRLEKEMAKTHAILSKLEAPVVEEFPSVLSVLPDLTQEGNTDEGESS